MTKASAVDIALPLQRPERDADLSPLPISRQSLYRRARVGGRDAADAFSYIRGKVRVLLAR